MHIDMEILFRFFLAVIWGSIVGAEREYRGKAAGFRTNIMISTGACFFTLMSMRIGYPGNQDRIASNIVTGIGFLGAGVIFRGDNRVNGITTAATIWAVAAIGMGIGAGYYFAASCGSVLILFVLAVLPKVENLIDHLNQSKSYTIRCAFTDDARVSFEQMFKQHHVHYKLVKQVAEGGQLTFTWHVQGPKKVHHALIAAIMQEKQFFYFES